MNGTGSCYCPQFNKLCGLKITPVWLTELCRKSKKRS